MQSLESNVQTGRWSWCRRLLRPNTDERLGLAESDLEWLAKFRYTTDSNASAPTKLHVRQTFSRVDGIAEEHNLFLQIDLYTFSYNRITFARYKISRTFLLLLNPLAFATKVWWWWHEPTNRMLTKFTRILFLSAERNVLSYIQGWQSTIITPYIQGHVQRIHKEAGC